MSSSPCPAHYFTASAHLLTPSRVSMTTTSPTLHRLKGFKSNPGLKYLSFSARPHGLCPSRNTSSIVSCTINMTAGDSDGPRKLNLDNLMDDARKVWESFPQPVKTFPWIKVADNFLQLINDLLYEVVKYLFVPLLAVTSLSEMSYCAHERKMGLIPIPILAGIAVAGVLGGTALELSPTLKEAQIPWHLAAMAIFFTLLKLPGPYYPYWGRIFIPHFANGGLLRTLWLAFVWYRRVKESPETPLQQNPSDGKQSEQKI